MFGALKRQKGILLAGTVAASMALIGAGCLPIGGVPTATPGPGATVAPGATATATPTPAAAAKGYVGADTCKTCHPDKYATFIKTGHPFKLNEVHGGPPTYPFSEVPNPPAGITWDDVTHVIGGFGWKARFIDKNGQIILGPAVQWNLATEAFSAYSNDADHTAPDGTPGPWDGPDGRKDYACGPCHMTGYDPDGVNHKGLPGFVGDWAFDGIQCEECHGPGADHVASMNKADINGDPDMDTVCGKCHTRKSEGIAASKGFIRHHEQWDEFSRSKHAQIGFDCMTCHDPHQPIFSDAKMAARKDVVAGNVRAMDGMDSPPGIIKECTDCHTDKALANPAHSDCKSCHMAFTGKSAVKLADNMGDVRSHVFKINTAADANMWLDGDMNPTTPDAAAFAQPFITLDFACLRCHTDRDLDWAAANATGIHD